MPLSLSPGETFPGPGPARSTRPRRVMLLGATGTIGQAAARALVARGHEVICFLRPRAGVGGRLGPDEMARLLPGAQLRWGDVLAPGALLREGFRGERFEALVSCLASRTGAPADAWAVDHRAHLQALEAARAVGVSQWVQLSALCVQKPLLAFQQAKLAFETELAGAGLRHAIVRPTAFFKSLCGQVERVRQGRPYLVFGDGRLTACKPISDADLADYLAACLDEPGRQGVLPIGGPGPAITPREQGEKLFELLGRPPRFKQVPIGLLDGVIAGLRLAGCLLPAAAAKAELARIGRYYATESMLVLNPDTGRYDAEATPSTGQDTLWQCYAALVRGEAAPQRGDHAVF